MSMAQAVSQQAILSTLAPETLQRRAANLARLDDFGADIAPALATFQRLYSEVALTQRGLRRLAGHATWALVTRLRLTAQLAQNPHIFARPLKDPIIIVGLPRTGTSYLLQLLAALPGRRFLRHWEAREPIPDADDDDRIARFEHFQEFAPPDVHDKHRVDVHGPEECVYLLDPSMVSISFCWVDAPCPAYEKWVSSDEHREPYAIYRQLLSYLQSTAPDRQLVLKSPAHFGQLTALLRAVPEARLVHTHRDPMRGLPSACSLFETMLGTTAVGVDRPAIGREMLGWYETVMARNEAQRAAVPPRANFDLAFADLARDPYRSIVDMHRHFGLDWTEAADAALRAELARGRPEQVGRHSYSLAECGLSEAEVAERLGSYRKRWGFA